MKKYICNSCLINPSKYDVYFNVDDCNLKIYLCEECAKLFKKTRIFDIKDWEGVELLDEKKSCSN